MAAVYITTGQLKQQDKEIRMKTTFYIDMLIRYKLFLAKFGSWENVYQYIS